MDKQSKNMNPQNQEKLQLLINAFDLVPKVLSPREEVVNDICAMDINKLKLTLKNQKYPIKSETVVLDRLGLIFDKCKAAGDTFLQPIVGVCYGCSNNVSGYVFVGNVSKIHFNLVFDMKGQKIKKLKECYKFRYGHKEFDFYSRVFINPYIPL